MVYIFIIQFQCNFSSADVHRLQREENDAVVNIEGFREKLLGKSFANSIRSTNDAGSTRGATSLTHTDPRTPTHAAKVTARCATAAVNVSTTSIDDDQFSDDAGEETPDDGKMRSEDSPSGSTTMTSAERLAVACRLQDELNILMQCSCRGLIDT